MARDTTIIISDLHSCYDELCDLLDKLKYDTSKHRLISVGDITDRGVGLKECIRLLRSVNAEVVVSNHEAKYLSYYKAQLKGSKTLPYLSDYKRSVYNSLDETDLIWFDGFPSKICVKDDTYVIHAGLEPAKPFALQDPYQIIRTRYVDKNGYAYKGKDQVNGTTFWANEWKGKQSIIFGHSFFETPTYFRNNNNTCIALDTGCVFGGLLTGYLFEEDRFIQVKARKTYWKRNK